MNIELLPAVTFNNTMLNYFKEICSASTNVFEFITIFNHVGSMFTLSLSLSLIYLLYWQRLLLLFNDAGFFTLKFKIKCILKINAIVLGLFVIVTSLLMYFICY